MKFRSSLTTLIAAFAITSSTLATTPLAAQELQVSAPAKARSQQTATIWWVIFNNPEACGDVCNGMDFPNPDVQASVLNATGTIVPAHGRAVFVSSLYRSTDLDTSMLFGPGLLDPMGAEIHAVVRWHGPVIPSLVDEQISTPSAGCPENGLPPMCVDTQFAVHFAGDEYSATEVRWWMNPDNLERFFGGNRNRAQRLAGTSVSGSWSTLRRSDDHVTLTLHTRLKPGN